MAKTTVNIHGKEYETVASRIQRFREEHPDWSIETDVKTDDDRNSVLVRTSIRNEQSRLMATGHAEEIRNSTQINRSSAIENCETSSVGRALAILGYGGTELASADELVNALNQQSDPEFHTSYLNVKKATPSSTITDKQIKLIEVRRNAMKAGNPSAYIEFQAWYALNFGEKPLKELTKAEASKLIDQLNG